MRASKSSAFFVGFLASHFAMAGSALPPAPLINAEAGLSNLAGQTLDSPALWKNQNANPELGFGYLHPANNTNDLRIKTENCDQIGVANNFADGDTGVCIFASTADAFTKPVSTSTFAAVSKPMAFAANDFYVPANPPAAYPAVTLARGKRFVCDVNNLNVPATTNPPANTNPYPCDASGNSSGSGYDCYDVTHVGTLATPAVNPKTERLSSRRIRIVVSNPKTAKAQVSNVIFLDSAAVNGPTFTDPSVFSLDEPAVSGDGQLLIVSTPRGMQYSYSNTPCDVTGWTVFKPITLMYQDANLRAKYGIARFPIRDTENNLIQPNTITSESGVPGGYMWMDTGATMLFFNSNQGNPAYYWDATSGKVVERYPVTQFSATSGTKPATATGADMLACTTEACLNSKMTLYSEFGHEPGMAFFGLWTNGKIVYPDTKLIKNSLGIVGGVQYQMSPYSGMSAPWMIQSGDIRRKAAAQNAFNHLPGVRPDNPNDVVWKVMTNEDIDEIAFDDYLHLDSLIISPMNASMTQHCPTSDTCTGIVNDGYLPAATNSYIGTTTGMTPHLQNQATSFPAAIQSQDATYISSSFPKWNVPAYGSLMGGGRIEPISAGGVRGAGLYLNGSNWVQYIIPNTQTLSMSQSSWFYSLWVDPRIPTGTTGSVLFALSDGSTLKLQNSTHLVVSKGSSTLSFTLPSGLTLKNEQWNHIALSVTTQGTGTSIGLYINGYLLQTQTLTGAAVFIPTAGGSVYLGGAGAGSLSAWVDDFKVVSRIPTPEEICRHAYGTLVGLQGSSDGSLWSYSQLFPATSHSAVASLLSNKANQFPAYVCETNTPYTSMPAETEGTYCIGNVRRPAAQPESSRCVGVPMVFPEGPILTGVPRPDSSTNNFCLSCHVSSHPSTTLTPSALSPSLAPAGTPSDWMSGEYYISEVDPKRRPLEERPWMSGMIPPNMFCAGFPAATMKVDLLTDDWEGTCP